MTRLLQDPEHLAREICDMDDVSIAAYVSQLCYERKLTKIVHALNEAESAPSGTAKAALDHLGFI
ncbi:hypothetical protein [Thioclava sp. GXIMD4215]|uniref:hypothetical protein n=1 Tax=Thioclava sp. GXIMD4215 TaxID=3131928 RepID=UPI003245FC03